MPDPHLQNPKCPNCNNILNNRISNISLTSYPPYECFGCECGFKGYVKLEFSDEGKKFNEETKDMPRRFAQGMRSTNDNWLINLKSSLDTHD